MGARQRTVLRLVGLVPQVTVALENVNLNAN